MFEYYGKGEIGNSSYAFTSLTGNDSSLRGIEAEFSKNNHRVCSARDIAMLLMKEGAFIGDFKSRFDGHITPTERILYLPEKKSRSWKLFLVRGCSEFPGREEVSHLLEDSAEYPLNNAEVNGTFYDKESLCQDRLMRFLWGDDSGFVELFSKYLDEAGTQMVELIPEKTWNIQGPTRIKEGNRRTGWINSAVPEYKPFTRSIVLSVGSVENKVVEGVYLLRGIQVSPWKGLKRTVYGIKEPETIDEAVVRDLENRGCTNEEIREILKEMEDDCRISDLPLGTSSQQIL